MQVYCIFYEYQFYRLLYPFLVGFRVTLPSAYFIAKQGSSTVAIENAEFGILVTK